MRDARRGLCFLDFVSVHVDSRGDSAPYVEHQAPSRFKWEDRGAVDVPGKVA